MFGGRGSWAISWAHVRTKMLNAKAVVGDVFFARRDFDVLEKPFPLGDQGIEAFAVGRGKVRRGLGQFERHSAVLVEQIAHKRAGHGVGTARRLRPELCRAKHLAHVGRQIEVGQSTRPMMQVQLIAVGGEGLRKPLDQTHVHEKLVLCADFEQGTAEIGGHRMGQLVGHYRVRCSHLVNVDFVEPGFGDHCVATPHQQRLLRGIGVDVAVDALLGLDVEQGRELLQAKGMVVGYGVLQGGVCASGQMNDHSLALDPHGQALQDGVPIDPKPKLRADKNLIGVGAAEDRQYNAEHDTGAQTRPTLPGHHDGGHRQRTHAGAETEHPQPRNDGHGLIVKAAGEITPQVVEYENRRVVIKSPKRHTQRGKHHQRRKCGADGAAHAGGEACGENTQDSAVDCCAARQQQKNGHAIKEVAVAHACGIEADEHEARDKVRQGPIRLRCRWPAPAGQRCRRRQNRSWRTSALPTNPPLSNTRMPAG